MRSAKAWHAQSEIRVRALNESLSRAAPSGARGRGGERENQASAIVELEVIVGQLLAGFRMTCISGISRAMRAAPAVASNGMKHEQTVICA